MMFSFSVELQNPIRWKLSVVLLMKNSPEEYLLEGSRLLRCEMALKLPVYVPVGKASGMFQILLSSSLNPPVKIIMVVVN